MPNSNKQLVNHLKKEGVLETPRIIDAFRAIDRADFVRKEQKGSAYTDHPLPIGEGQTISQPFTVAFMLEKLQPKPGEKILDVGSGSGWTTALLAYCVGVSINKEFEVGGEKKEANEKKNQPPGIVVGVELRERLCQFGCKNTAKYFETFNCCTELGLEGFGKSNTSVLFSHKDGSRGVPKLAPFNAILVSASTPKAPKAWKEQLKMAGKLVFPSKGALWKYEKVEESHLIKDKYPGFRFVRLKTRSD